MEMREKDGLFWLVWWGFFWFLFLFLLFRISLNMIEYFSIVCLNVLTVL